MKPIYLSIAAAAAASLLAAGAAVLGRRKFAK